MCLTVIFWRKMLITFCMSTIPGFLNMLITGMIPGESNIIAVDGCLRNNLIHIIQPGLNLLHGMQACGKRWPIQRYLKAYGRWENEGILEVWNWIGPKKKKPEGEKG